MVAPRSLPRQCLEDVSGGVRVHQALCLPVGLLVLAQCCARFYAHVCAGPFSSCIALRLRMLGPHSRVLEGFVQPLLHALVLDHLVQLCVATIFNVAIGCFYGFTCQQSSAEHCQVCSSVAPLVIAIPHGVLHRRPYIRPLLRALLAAGRLEGHELSTGRVTPSGSQDRSGSSRSAALSLGTCPQSVASAALL